MAVSRILGLSVLVLQVLSIYSQEKKDPPVISGSYKAIGELSESPPGIPDAIVQIAFEENYDSANQKSSFTIWEDGKNATYIENYATNQTFRYVDNKDGTDCNLTTKATWIAIEAPPSLIGYDADGKIRFTLQKLLEFNGPDYKMFSSNEIYRNIPADMWVYERRSKEGEFDTIVTLYAYWSNETWNTTASKGPIPLGFQLTKIVEKKPTPVTVQQNINIFAFVRNVVDQAIFEPYQGVYCEGIISELTIPTLPKIDALSFHSELALANYLQVKNIDTWYDMKNKLLRIDMDRMMDQQPEYLKQGRKITTEITSKELGATFQINIFQGKLSCVVINLDKYSFEAQDIINPKLPAANWTVGNFFGVNTTGYRYIGKTTKRNIPCHLFQGKREDWPEESSGTVSIWEWCVAASLKPSDGKIEFRDGELPIVALNIFIVDNADPDFPPGSKLAHHLYDVLQEDPNVMYLKSFDVSRCFKREQVRNLQFTVDANINSGNLHIFENATSDVRFLYLWLAQISQATGLSIPSLRITKIRSTIYNNVMYTMFTLLDVHSDLPKKDGVKSLKTVEDDLRSAIDKGSVKITYDYEPGKPVLVGAVAKTLTEQLDPTKMTHITAGSTTESVITTGRTGNTGEIVTGTARETTPKDDTKSTPSGQTDSSGSTPTDSSGSTPTGSSGSTPTDSSGSTPTGSSGSTPTGSSGSTPTGSSGSTPTGSSGSTPTGSSGSTPTDSSGSSTTPKDTDRSSTTSSGTPTPTKKDPETDKLTLSGNSSGTVAGVTVAMLIVGMTIGAVGTFYKFRGTPQFGRR